MLLLILKFYAFVTLLAIGLGVYLALLRGWRPKDSGIVVPQLPKFFSRTRGI